MSVAVSPQSQYFAKAACPVQLYSNTMMHRQHQGKFWKKRLIMFSQLKTILLYLCIPCYFLQGLPLQGSYTDGNKMVGKNDLLNWALPVK